MKKAIKAVANFIFSYQFSKILMLMETFLVLYITKEGFELARLCIENQYTGSLPWIAAMVTSAWAAYMASASCYYHKSGKEEVAKIDKFGTQNPISIDTGDKPTI